MASDCDRVRHLIWLPLAGLWRVSSLESRRRLLPRRTSPHFAFADGFNFTTAKLVTSLSPHWRVDMDIDLQCSLASFALQEASFQPRKISKRGNYPTLGAFVGVDVKMFTYA